MLNDAVSEAEKFVPEGPAEAISVDPSALRSSNLGARLLTLVGYGHGEVTFP